MGFPKVCFQTDTLERLLWIRNCFHVLRSRCAWRTDRACVFSLFAVTGGGGGVQEPGSPEIRASPRPTATAADSGGSPVHHSPHHEAKSPSPAPSSPPLSRSSPESPATGSPLASPRPTQGTSSLNCTRLSLICVE